MKKLDPFYNMEVLFPENFQSISRIFVLVLIQPLHTMELDKTMEIGLSKLFLQYFQNISILWKKFNFSSGYFM